MIFAHTDTSLKNGVSTHSYILRTYSGKKLKEVIYVSHETNTIQAEMDSIVKLLNWCSSKKINKIRVYTDSKRIVNAVNSEYEYKFDVSYLKHMLNKTESVIKWKPRTRNIEADRLCRKHMKVVMNRINNT